VSKTKTPKLVTYADEIDYSKLDHIDPSNLADIVYEQNDDKSKDEKPKPRRKPSDWELREYE